jgi:hypothetical protein
MKPLSALILSCMVGSCAIFGSCHSAPAPDYTPLTETSMYVIDSVRLAATGGDENAALNILEQAATLYKKGPDTAKSIELFKQSILTRPTAKAYYDLAGALVTTHQYVEAIWALRIAERLGYTPLANVMYRYTMAYGNRAGDDKFHGTPHDSALYYMELAIQMGYSRPQQFLRRDLFPALFVEGGADEVYNQVVAAGSGLDKDRTLWELYKNHFFSIQLPLVIDSQWSSDHPNDSYADISEEFDRFIPAMQNDHWEREPDFSYYYVGQVTENPAWSAVIYCIEPAESIDPQFPGSYYLSTYDTRGDVIDTLQVAGAQESGSPFKVFKIRPSLQFSVQDFVYATDSTSSGSDSTHPKHLNALPPVAFRIAANGKFEKVEALTLR